MTWTDFIAGYLSGLIVAYLAHHFVFLKRWRRVQAFLKWQLSEDNRKHHNINWNDALREVASVMEGGAPARDLLQRDVTPPCPAALRPQTTEATL